MATQQVGTAGFKYTPTGGTLTTVSLGSRLHAFTVKPARARIAVDSADYTVREVINIGTESKQEVECEVRFHDDAQELYDLVDAGLSGVTLAYYENVSSPRIGDPYYCTMIAGTVKPDRDRAGLGEYEAKFTLRVASTTDDFSNLFDLA